MADKDPCPAAQRLAIALSWTNRINMKKRIAWMCAAIMTVACQKEQILDKAVEQPEGGAKTGLRRFFEIKNDDGFPTQMFCHAEGGNCLNDVTVRPLHATDMDAVLAAVRSGVQVAIVNAFTAHRTMLLDYIEATDVDKVIAASMTARAGDGKFGGQFLLLCDAQGNVSSAYPIFIEERE